MTVLVAHKPGARAPAVLDAGVAEARRRRCALVVVNVDHGYAVRTQGGLDATQAAELETDLRARGVEARVHLATGPDAAAVIADEVVARAVAVLVIGHRRRSPVGKLLLGSTAQRLILTADCPVLTVKA